MKSFSVFVVVLGMATLGCGAKSDATPGPESAVAAPVEQGVEATPTETEPIAAQGDLTLVEIPNAKISQGVLTGGQPAAEQYSALAEAGYMTVIDLRTAGEAGSEDNAGLVEAAGMVHVHIPVDGADGINTESVQRFADALAQAQGPIVVHCGSGNRVGAMFGMKAFWVDGATQEEALAAAQDAGVTRLEAHVKSLLAPSK